MIDDMAVYIANLGKYNEGYLVGAWFTFPIDEEDVKEKIGRCAFLWHICPIHAVPHHDSGDNHRLLCRQIGRASCRERV